MDGGKTIQIFLDSGLIHHMTISRIPILLGEGIPLFAGGPASARRKLEHISSQSYSNGVVISKYDVVFDDNSDSATS